VVGNLLVFHPGGSPLGFIPHGPYNGIDDDCFYQPGQRPPIGGLPPPTQPPPEREQPI
jgi:hypothetical protein